MAFTAEDVVRRLNAQGRGVRLIGRCGGGATGQAFDVEALDGRYVLKWQQAGDGVPFGRVATALERLRAAGYPVPVYEVLDAGEDLDVSLQEPLPGQVVDAISADVRAELLRLIELQSDRGVASDGPSWVDLLCGITLEGAPGWCRHESLESHSDATRDLWRQIMHLVLGLDRAAVPSGDVVHMDLHHRNVLQSDGNVCGVIDWEGAECGDRRFDIMTLAFYSGVAGWTREQRTGWIVEAAAAMSDSAARLYVSHLAVRSVDWAIRHETEADVQRWLRWSWDGLGVVR
jgi:hypothetical protein